MFLLVPLASAALGGAAAKAQQIIRRKRGGAQVTSEILEEQLANTTRELDKRSKELHNLKLELEKERIVTKEQVEGAEKVKSEQVKKIEQLEEKAREQSAKIESLEQEKAALQSELEEMKSKVGEVLSLLFHRQCSEAEATARLSLLGCEIEYVNDAEVFEMLEAKESKWEAGSSQFLLDDKQKLSKLMEGRQQLALTAGLSADSSHRSRLPIVSFPTPRISQPGGSAPRSLVQPLKLPDFSAKSTSKAIKPCSPDTLPSIKDQDMKLADDTYSSLSLDSISSLPDVDHIKSRGPTLKFVYSVQGGGSTSSQPWIAKLPFAGESPVVNSPIKPMKDLTFKAEMTSDEFGQGLAMVMGRK